MSAELREELFSRLLDPNGEGICTYCGKRISRTRKLSDPRRATLDHRIPLSKGGKNEPANIALACRPCNDRKGSLTAEIFRRLR